LPPRNRSIFGTIRPGKRRPWKTSARRSPSPSGTRSRPTRTSPSSRLSAAMAAKAVFSFRAEHIWLSRPINGDTQIAARIGSRAKMQFSIHPHMLRDGRGYALANAGHDTRALQAWLGHKNIQHTVRYTELAPDRFKNFWRD